MKIAIIGAGASGLMLATLLEKNKIEYDIYNKGKVGRKILASGNGKCNISNINISPSYYHNNSLTKKIINDEKEALFNYLKELEIYTKVDDEGRMYPISESSQSILNILLKNIKRPIFDEEVKHITKVSNKYKINDNNKLYDKIVISTGSIANMNKPYYSYEYINDLNIKFNKFIPSLVGFKTKMNLKPISGVRLKCMASLITNNKTIHEENGEVIFKDDGISGICIMNLSSYFNDFTFKNSYIKLSLDVSKYNSLESVLPPKLFEYVLKNKIDISNFIIPISGLYDMVYAQVCKGGIDINELNDNLSLKKDNNIFAQGEVIDVDGTCGGFNLSFAFMCALKIAGELI